MSLAGVTLDAEEVRTALARGREVIWRTQHPDGFWESLCDMGPTPTAQVLVAVHHAGALAEADATAGARWLRGRQQTDGSFRAHPTAQRGDLGATASAWAALHLLAAHAHAHPHGDGGGDRDGDHDRDRDEDSDGEAIARARRYVDDHGGTPAVIDAFARGDPAAVYLALAGLIDPSELPCPPMVPALIRPLVRFTERRFHAGILMASGALTLIAHRLRGDSTKDGPPSGSVARRFVTRTLRLLATFQNRDGTWNQSTVQTALILPALRAAGLSADHPMVARTVSWLHAQRVRDETGLHFEAFGSPGWCTAGNLRALMAAGEPPGDPGVQRALQWLIDAQSELEQPEVDNRNPGAPRTGGWAFQPGNETMVDNDDTGAVLTAFGAVSTNDSVAPALEPDLAARVRESRDLGLDWLLGMQNPDGGWSAFVHGLPAKRAGPLFTEAVQVSLDGPLGALRVLIDPPRELGDPSTEDLTGRVLDGLGRIGLSPAAPAVQRAIGFLRVQQFEHGGFWGRWTVNYLAATACVLKASLGSAPTCPSPGFAGRSGSSRSARTPTADGASCPILTAIPRWPAEARACRR